MQGVKYFIRDYEQATGDRLTDFRRHVNSYLGGGGQRIGGGGQGMSMPRNVVVDGIMDFIDKNAPSWDDATSIEIKGKLGLPQYKLMPNEPTHGRSATRFTEQELRQFLIDHPELRQSEFIQAYSKPTRKYGTTTVRATLDESDYKTDEFKEKIEPRTYGTTTVRATLDESDLEPDRFKDGTLPR